MITKTDAWMMDEDWFSRGKDDAWSGRPKHSPIQDPCAASLYDLGYSEGLIGHSPNGDRPNPLNR